MKNPPKWIKAIPQSNAHGSGALQKRLWRLCSDFVRIRDWSKSKRCIASNRPIYNWKDGQAGHFISYSKCNGIFKFDTDNIFLQSAYSNAWGDYDDWKEFERQINLRGIDTDELRVRNRDTPLKFRDADVIEEMKNLLTKIGELKIHPEYYDRAIKLLNS